MLIIFVVADSSTFIFAFLFAKFILCRLTANPSGSSVSNQDTRAAVKDFTSIRFVSSLPLCILGGQSDQGYGSKDELHQDSIDACKTTAFPLSADGQANKSKTVKGKPNNNADIREIFSS